FQSRGHSQETARVDGDREFKSDRDTVTGICGEGGGPDHRRPLLPTVTWQLIGFAHPQLRTDLGGIALGCSGKEQGLQPVAPFPDTKTIINGRFQVSIQQVTRSLVYARKRFSELKGGAATRFCRLI